MIPSFQAPFNYSFISHSATDATKSKILTVPQNKPRTNGTIVSPDVGG
jgi:hypothetical protein